jgi:hypothetical protein
MNIYIAGSLFFFPNLWVVECRSKHRRFYCLLLFSIVSFLQFRFLLNFFSNSGQCPIKPCLLKSVAILYRRNISLMSSSLLFFFHRFISTWLFICLSVNINISGPSVSEGYWRTSGENKKFDKKVKAVEFAKFNFVVSARSSSATYVIHLISKRYVLSIFLGSIKLILPSSSSVISTQVSDNNEGFQSLPVFSKATLCYFIGR